jgi:hypothetical protein
MIKIIKGADYRHIIAGDSGRLGYSARVAEP